MRAAYVLSAPFMDRSLNADLVDFARDQELLESFEMCNLDK